MLPSALITTFQGSASATNQVGARRNAAMKKMNCQPCGVTREGALQPYGSHLGVFIQSW
ncbi:hypothetical protein D083_3164 [Dickeya solani RNS 08.23.3.1.A]|nr:hypothetical protein D083_3164 [Dickeya solani RNS 08.23.3.1.A]